jgi:hypothetical protein
MDKIFNAQYFGAVGNALENGMIALMIMLVLGFVFNILAGGMAARNWKKTDHAH